MVTSAKVYSPPRGKTILGYWDRIAAAKLGLQPASLISDLNDYGRKGEGGYITHTTITAPATRTPQLQALRLSTGVNGEFTVYDAPRSAGDFAPRSVAAGAAVKVFLVCRMKFNTAVSATASMGCGLFDSATSINVIMGGRGPVSTTHYQCYGAVGTTINSGIALDTGVYHTHIYWRDGATSYYQIDNNAPVAGDVRVLNDSLRGICVRDTVSGANREIDFAWSYLAVSGP